MFPTIINVFGIVPESNNEFEVINPPNPTLYTNI